MQYIKGNGAPGNIYFMNFLRELMLTKNAYKVLVSMLIF